LPLPPARQDCHNNARPTYTQAEVVAIAQAPNPGVPDNTQSQHYTAHFEANLFEGPESAYYVVTKELWIVTKEIGFINLIGSIHKQLPIK
jgi:hypothetical protein